MRDEIDRILAGEEVILPSSGFAAAVMETVRREALTPPPIPFPWLRALPGIVVTAVALAVVIAELIMQTVKGFSAPQALAAWPAWLAPVLQAPILNPQIVAAGAWAALALLLSLGTVVLSTHLVSHRA
jgi:hypothetical protein